MGMPFACPISGWMFNRFQGLLYPPWVRSVLEMAGWHLPEGGKVLDVGGGTGTMGRLIAGPRKLSVWVADPAPGMLRHGRGIHPVLARAPGLPFRRGIFDAVCAGEALHHFRSPGEALEEMVHLLAPKGFLILYDFDPTTLLGGMLQRAEKLFGEPGHFFAPQRLRERLSRMGMHARIFQKGFRYVLLASPARHPVLEEVSP